MCFPFCQNSPPFEAANHARSSASTKSGPPLSETAPSAAGYVTNTLSRKRSIPCALPTQRFPSRSSKIAVTAPPRFSDERTPLALIRASPLAVPTHMFDSRSLDKASVCERLSERSAPSRVSSVPFQRARPLSVPIHNSRSPTGKRQLTFLSCASRSMRESWPLRREKSPASRDPIQTVPSAVSAIEIARKFVGVDLGARGINFPPLYLTFPLAMVESRTSPLIPRHMAVTPASICSNPDKTFSNFPSR